MKPNIAKTQAYYHALVPESICDCAYCQNYYARVREAYPAVAQYLSTLGIDIAKPFELSPLEPDHQGYLEYCVCEYIVFGTCPQEYHHRIGGVQFVRSDSHPHTGIEEEHFVLAFSPITLRFGL